MSKKFKVNNFLYSGLKIPAVLVLPVTINNFLIKKDV